MAKLNKPTKNLAWLLLLPLIIGAITFAQNTGSKEVEIVRKPVKQHKVAIKTKPEKSTEVRGHRSEVRKPKANVGVQSSDVKRPIPEKKIIKQNPEQSAPEKKQSSSKPTPKKKEQKPKIIASKSKVTLNVDKGNGPTSYSVEVEPGSTVLVVLKTASTINGFSLRYTNYSYGAFIEELDGVSNDPANGMYWLYYINDKLSNLGASSQRVKKGDKILWKYEQAQ